MFGLIDVGYFPEKYGFQAHHLYKLALWEMGSETSGFERVLEFKVKVHPVDLDAITRNTKAT
eukprot:snap_masked-scaffold_110-processed-gene-0.5-mRNA-1 protein AED:1.00 eAED:1.00 QI:0/-1/0/0/-1/1/1/0/61